MLNPVKPQPMRPPGPCPGGMKAGGYNPVKPQPRPPAGPKPGKPKK